MKYTEVIWKGLQLPFAYLRNHEAFNRGCLIHQNREGNLSLNWREKKRKTHTGFKGQGEEPDSRTTHAPPRSRRLKALVRGPRRPSPRGRGPSSAVSGQNPACSTLSHRRRTGPSCSAAAGHGRGTHAPVVGPTDDPLVVKPDAPHQLLVSLQDSQAGAAFDVPEPGMKTSLGETAPRTGPRCPHTPHVRPSVPATALAFTSVHTTRSCADTHTARAFSSTHLGGSLTFHFIHFETLKITRVYY